VLKFGSQDIFAVYVGGTKIKEALIGETIVFHTVPPEPVQYTITLHVDPEGGGTASGGGIVESGADVTVTAVPGRGNRFGGWRENGAVVSTDPTYTFPAASDRNLTAVFVAIPVFTVTASISPAGSGTITGAGTYAEGTEVTLVAAPADGYEFTGWQENGAIVSEGAEYTFVVSRDRSLTAEFEEAPASRLPEGYAEVEYIQSNGTQYINVGSFNTNYRIVIDAEPLGEGTLFGGYDWFSTGISKPVAYTYFLGGVFAPSIGFNYYTSGFKTTSDDITPRRILIEADAYMDTVSLNGKTLSIAAGNTSSAGSFKKTIRKLGLFARIDYPKTQSKPYAPANFISARLYSCRIYSNTTNLLKDFIPCVQASSGTVGLYDIVNNVFYKSESDTEFAAGPAV